jgi:hypothetical protein
MASTIEVKIGQFSRTYIAFETFAPREYDGFGTIEIYSGNRDGDVVRYVLIDVEHKTWQVGRYGSGLYHSEEIGGLDGHIQGILYDKLVA